MKNKKVCPDCNGDGWVYHSKGGQSGETKDCPSCTVQVVKDNLKEEKMKNLTAEDLFALQYGDQVYRFDGTNFDSFRYVGRMPSSPDRYLIFSEGEKLAHLYIHTDGTFKGEWYSGKFDANVWDELEIKSIELKIESLTNRLNWIKSLKE